MQEILDVLVARHVNHDVAINAQRLIPRHGWLVEYEHWGHDEPPKCHVAFIGFLPPLTGGRSGGVTLVWSQFTHQKR